MPFRKSVAQLAPRSQFGMTLIELMIAIVIVAILAAIALPAYDDSVRKSRRAEGKSQLMNVLQQQERFFLNNMRYSADLAELGYAGLVSGALPSENGFYNISAAACGGVPVARCVLLTATPQNGHSDDGNMMINSRGEKSATGKALKAGDWK